MVRCGNGLGDVHGCGYGCGHGHVYLTLLSFHPPRYPSRSSSSSFQICRNHMVIWGMVANHDSFTMITGLGMPGFWGSNSRSCSCLGFEFKFCWDHEHGRMDYCGLRWDRFSWSNGFVSST